MVRHARRSSSRAGVPHSLWRWLRGSSRCNRRRATSDVLGPLRTPTGRPARTAIPFLDVQFSAEFRQQHRSVEVDGFLRWRRRLQSSLLTRRRGRMELRHSQQSPRTRWQDRKPSAASRRPPASHGPVSVRNTYDFGYADGTPYFPFGTTCYAWTHQPAALQEQTIETLRHAPFNKMRMCVFPKWYTYNRDEPPVYPFRAARRARTTTPRFVPEFFHTPGDPHRPTAGARHRSRPDSCFTPTTIGATP